MSKHIITGPLVIAPFTADCTDPPYCVAVGRKENTITITSDVPAHSDGKIDLSVEQFETVLSTIKNEPDLTQIDPFQDTDSPVGLGYDGEDMYLVGPGGARVLFYAYELSQFYQGVRNGEFDSRLRLDTLVAATA